ncbi:ABC transporter permease [Amphiplicatus metriothermophilus]|uniref:Iron(III) transport system permease protein n=1 Tax=Amphiplicatus metriothermophilus TaxID=1519374 RepID=A0A239PJ11_9PROT|nr:iron ABC transporter permease [Amphiplicatus metriothermophilus]MBB5517875.1 iron(III) transport system permease protein [Amphiplicatus metriothermophilus]SNT67791.1 iron(III) transport system permease protein [Amphiplicatus metriothermophilus]
MSRPARRAGWLAPATIAVLVLAPVGFVLTSLASGFGEAQTHVWTTTGPRYLAGTLMLCAIVGAASAIVGAGAAALIALAEFPGRRLFAPALVLPFAVPAYISAYAWADLFDPFGPLAAAGGSVAIRSLPGAAFILTLATYPYVYLAMRASLEARSGAYLDAARSLGAHPLDAVLRVFLPAGRAALAGGVALALMETAADFGVADYFGVATLSVGIFRTWYGLGDLLAASQIAAGLFFVTLLLILIEETARRGLGAETLGAQAPRTRLRLKGAAAAGAVIFCAAPVALGFVVPVGALAALAFAGAPEHGARGLAQAAANTGLVAALGAALAMTLAIALAYAARAARSPKTRALIRIASMGYAVPGAVLAIGVLALAAAGQALTGLTVGGVGLLVYAYAARFLTVGYNAAAAGLAQLHPQTDEAAQTLGAGPSRIILRVHAPLARPALAAGVLIVVIDIAKELPATLLLRPFNFETLATHVYRLASDERLAQAAPAALALIGLSLIPTFLASALAMSRKTQRVLSMQ